MRTRRDPSRLWQALALVLLLGTAVLALAGCDLPSGAQPAPATDTPTAPEQSQPTPNPTEAAEATPPASSVITLTLWTTESFSPTQTSASGQILAEQAQEFEANHPNVQLRFIQKKPYGKGGILDYLLTTKAAVPALLPDLVFVDVSELGSAVQAQVVQPLGDLIPPDLAADLYSFARRACTFDGQLYGLQFQADLEHLVYNTGQLTVPPRSWPGVLSNPGAYLFPAGGVAGLVNDGFFIQYLAVRPWPVEGEPGAPFLDAESLTAVFQFYQDGVSRGVFPTRILGYHSTDDCWLDYLAGDAALTHVKAHRYLMERQGLPSSAVAPIPTINGAGAAIGQGWALALVTSDPTRQSLAVELMTQLMSPASNAAWNQAASYLPTRQQAMAQWDEEDSYIRFAKQQLETAQPRPRLANYTQIAAALQKAVEAIINGTITPEQAAEQVIENAQ